MLVTGTVLRTASDGLQIDLTVTNPDNTDYSVSLDDDSGLFALSENMLETAVVIDREVRLSHTGTSTACIQRSTI